MLKRLPFYLTLASFTLLLILVFGWYFLAWNLVTIIPFAIATTILFFQLLTLIRINSLLIRKINRILLFFQISLLGLFLLTLVDIVWIWKINMLLFLISAQFYILDLAKRYHIRKSIAIVLACLCFVSLLAFLLLPYMESCLPIGIISLLASFLLVFIYVIGKKNLPLNQL